jgi:hypothetical protein
MHPTRTLLLSLLLLLSALPGSFAAADTTGRAAEPAFDSVPTAAEIVGGAVQISLTNTSEIGWAILEFSDASDTPSWSELSNLSGVPWTYSWDSSGETDGDYRLRVSPFYASNESAMSIFESADFTLDNTAPTGLSLSLDAAQLGDGSSSVNRGWLNVANNGSLTIHWDATDTHLRKATISGVPGPGAPSADGPGPLVKRWDWSSGAFAEGTYTVTLTVYDDAGNTASRQLFLGIDRSGPTAGNPTLSQAEETWTDSTVIYVQNLAIGATDNGGSGISDYEWRFDSDSWTSLGAGGASSLSLPEGVHTLSFRAVDKLGNAGPSIDQTMWADHSAAVPGGWLVPEVTSSTNGAVALEIHASDTLSGIDLDNSTLQYGFDSDGLGITPDITTRWIDFDDGLSGSLPSSIDWSTKQGDWLMLRAVLQDVAGNQEASTATFIKITPGLDISLSEVEIDRLIVAVGFRNEVHINATLVTNEAYMGSVTVRLEQAPSNRDSSTSWTTLETRTVAPGSLLDSNERLEDWTVTLLSAGEYDIRLVVDPDNQIDERDEGNNEAFLVINGARPRTINAVSGFVPGLIGISAVGIWLAWTMRRRNEGE